MSIHARAQELVAQMTLAEKASLCSGKNFWYLKGIPRLGLPEILVTDGPHGLRKQEAGADHLGINQSVPAVCFPTASAIACSFDRELVNRVGVAIGEECRQEEVAVLLGPGLNIKRSPLCGRNFEYFSEDPFVSGELASAFTNGVQSQQVGVSLKHFAANNQETRRMISDSVIDERTLREIYLAGFERTVKQSKPWTVMAAYNRVNGEYASQNRRLLCDILREEWGFDGLVVSDWGATVDRVQAVAAGLDLEMPYLNGVRDARIVAAVESGALPMGDLDAAATRVTELILRVEARQPMRYAAEEHRALACRAATQSAVLLKNINNILPGNAQQCAAVIGAFAKQPRYQGTGSSKIVPLQLDNAFDTLAGLGLKAEYAPGYRIDSDAPDAMLVEEACRVARDKEIVYIFAGLPDSYEAETFDRENLAMPQNHVELIEAVCQVNDRVVVVLQGGSPMELPWEERVQGILMMYLGGEASGCACAELLLGLQNPSGKLAESWPLVLEDTPAYGNFPGYPLTVEYREGIFVGYRYYDSAAKAVRYPFGYGLSYTQFTYGDLRLSAQHIRDDEPFVVTCRVTNSGTVAGAEIAQLYVAMPDSAILRAAQELKGFEKVFLKPGESREINFTLEQRDFAYYNTAIADWHVESGTYQIRVGASSRDIRLTGQVVVQSTRDAPLPDVHALAPGYYDLSQGVRISDAEFRALLGREIPARAREKGALHSITSTMTDIQDRWFGRQLWALLNRQLEEMVFDSSDVKMMARKMMPDMPLYFLQMKGGITLDQIEGIVDILNGRLIRGVRKLVQKNGKRLD